VLEQVGKPGVSRPLVLGTHVIPDIYGDDGDVMVLVNDDVEAV
jgi:hypothetical protein